MNDYQLGVRLRQQILGDLERGLASDGRRLQALVGDFCGDSQGALLPALHYLVMTPAFSHGLAQRPPLPADARLQLRLEQELAQLFAPPICARLQLVVRGLLGLPEGASPPGSQPADALPRDAAPAVALEAPEPPAPSMGTPPTATAMAVPPQGNGGVVALLSFIAGVLVVAVGGVLAWLVLASRQPQELTSAPPQPTSQEPAPATPLPTLAPAAAVADLEPDPVARQRAIASVQELYAELSRGDAEAARRRFSAGAADQFDPAFFRQFERVSIDNLQELRRQGSTLELLGAITFVYPDGTSQRESRRFTVDTASDPPLVTASSFGEVLSPRP